MECKHHWIFWSFGLEKCFKCNTTRKPTKYGLVRASPIRRRKPRKTCEVCGHKVRGESHALHCRKKVD